MGVKAQRADDGQADTACSGNSGFHLFARGHGLNPHHIGTTGGQSPSLFGEGSLCQFFGEGANGFHDFAGRANAAGHHHGTAAFISHFARYCGGGGVEFGHAALGLVQLQAVLGATKAVGQDDVGTGVDKTLVQLGNAVRVLGVPQFGRVT